MTNGHQILISHSRADGQYAIGLAIDLESYGFKTWYAGRDLPTGADAWQQVEAAAAASSAAVAIVGASGVVPPHQVSEVELLKNLHKPLIGVALGEFALPPRGLEAVSAWGVVRGLAAGLMVAKIADQLAEYLDCELQTDNDSSRWDTGPFYPDEWEERTGKGLTAQPACPVKLLSAAGAAAEVQPRPTPAPPTPAPPPRPVAPPPFQPHAPAPPPFQPHAPAPPPFQSHAPAPPRGWNPPRRRGIGFIIWMILIAWFLVGLVVTILGLTGVFGDDRRGSPRSSSGGVRTASSSYLDEEWLEGRWCFGTDSLTFARGRRYSTSLGQVGSYTLRGSRMTMTAPGGSSTSFTVTRTGEDAIRFSSPAQGTESLRRC